MNTSNTAGSKDGNAGHVCEDHGTADGGTTNSSVTFGEHVSDVPATCFDSLVLARVDGALSESLELLLIETDQ